VLVVGGVLTVVGLAMLLAPLAVARFAHTVRISVPEPDRGGRLVLATRVTGIIFIALAMATVAASAWG
jgi:hypothetical protein